MPLTIEIDGAEAYNAETNEFVYIKPTKLTLEHSLVSVSKWESKWELPFTSTYDKTPEMILDYIKFMTLTKNVDPNVYMFLTKEHYEQIREYMEKPHHANTFQIGNPQRNNEVVTAETIYYSMATQGIWKECEKWHLNKLLALLELSSIKNSPGKKMSRSDLYRRQREINNARRKKFAKKKG